MAAEYVDGLPSDIVDFVKVDRMRHGDKVMFQSWVLPLRVHCFAAAGAPCHATREVVDPASCAAVGAIVVGHFPIRRSSPRPSTSLAALLANRYRRVALKRHSTERRPVSGFST